MYISSHYLRFTYIVYKIWNAAIAVNRRVVAVSWTSKRHYHDVDSISLCDIFSLPSSVECTAKSNVTIFSEHDCLYIGTSHKPSDYGWDNIPKSISFEYKDVDCIAGPASPNVGIYPSMTRKNIVSPETQLFTDRYLNILPKILAVFGVDYAKGYTIVHWRRGDQLETRCNGKIDKSVNCGSIDDFLKELEYNLEVYVPFNKGPIPTYIATNEKSSQSIKKIQENNYFVFDDIKKGLKEMSFTSLDIFVFELMMMIDCTYLFAWGVSSINNFLYRYRYQNKQKKHNTIFNGVRIYGHQFHQNEDGFIGR